MVVQACPEPCIDDLVAKVIRHFEMVYGIQVASWSGCIEKWISRLKRSVPRKLLNTSAIADVIVPWAAGYSGWFGVTKSGRQPNCSTVAALASSYPG